MSSTEDNDVPLSGDEELFALGAELRKTGGFYDIETEKAQLGHMLRVTRQRNELTMDQLSLLTKAVDPEKVGVSRVAISRYETGASFPGYREIKLLAFALRTSVSSLVYARVDPLEITPSLDSTVHKIVMDILIDYGILKDDSPKFDGAIHNQLLAKVKKATKSK